ncbi:DMT family transporter [Pendulispora brunnea]|uniref:DMT family transporter n=1 Tax=Pendulispora brunnea TaxID=2905690 RepID=A0ABZ2JZW6_9BACT
MSSNRHPWAGALLVLLSNVCFGTTGPAAKAVIGVGLSPFQVVQLRLMGTSLTLLVIALLRDPKSLRITRGSIPFLLGYGLLGFFGIQLLYFIALARLPVGVALLLEYMAVVLVALWARFVQKRTLAPTTWVGIGLAVVGVALIEQVWRGPVLDAVGAIAGFGSAICLAAYFLMGERGVGGRHPLALAALGSTVGAAACIVLAPPWTLPLARLGETAPLGPLAAPAWMAMAYVILVGTVAAYLTGIAALRYLPSPVAGVMSTFEIVIASTVAWLLLGEKLSAIELTGAATLFMGVVLAQVGNLRKPASVLPSSTPRPSPGGAVSSPR